jgi:two-component system chemotaxis sensor kinase CheA
MMPEIRAMVLLNHVKTVAEVTATIPDDLDADSAGDDIAANGFIIKLKTDNPDLVEEQLKSGINVQSAERLKKPEKPKTTQSTPEKPVQAESAAEKKTAPSAPTAPTAKKGEDKSGAMISVKLEKLDRLMKLAAEIVIAQSGVLHSSDLAPYKSRMPNFYKSARELKKLTDELQDMVMSVRMVPVNAAFSKMNRVVRDMNKTLGKNVTLVFEGEQTEVDKSVVDMLGDPLMHLVRNAVDHGIEPPEERAASGKTEPPTVTLKAYYESNDVLISVTDNGAGMNAQALLNKARSKGILTKPEQEYTEQDCFALIMAAGFSTNEQVTEYSGRGVGMDVVKKNLEKVGGTLLVDSVYGKGSTFTIRVPMSLSISDCMGIMLGGQEYAVPVASLTEVFRAKPEQIIITPDGKEMVQRDKLYKIIRLSEHFGIENCECEYTNGIMLLCSTAQGEAALFADSILEDMQIVVKPFPAYLSRFGLKESGFSGTSVLGDGSIILALDVNEIIKGGL